MRLIVLKNHVPINEVLVETPDFNERYEIYVGRSEDCHVQIEDPLISRHHFVLKNENGKWLCEKLSQLGAVNINGNTSAKMEVQEGDEIKCGAYSLMVTDMPAVVKTFQQTVYQAPEPVHYQQEVKVKQSPVAAMAEIDDMDDDSLQVEEQEVTSMMSSSEATEAPEEAELNPEENNEEFSDSDNSFTDEDPAEDNLLPAESFGENEVAGFGDEAVEGEGSDNESTRFFKAFVNYQLVLFGDHAPYDRYQIDSQEIFIGRDPKKCQIILDDPEVSTVHAVLRKNNIDITLEDLNSSNGTILNGERINKAHLSTGDEFVIGSTSFSLETRSDLLDAESDRLMPVEAGQMIETEEIEEEMVDVGDGDVDFNTEAPLEKSMLKRIWKDPAKRKKLIYAVAGGIGAWLYFADSAAPPQVKKAPVAKVDPAKEKNAKPVLQISKEAEQKRNMSYELGVSFFEQNKYFEALKEFQTVMEIDPNYKKVSTYFDQTKAGLKRLQELEAQKRAEEERLKTKREIEELLVKAREAVKEKQVTLAESFFSQIAEKDPENIEVQQLKMELEAWQREQERIALEKATKEAARKSMVDALIPGKTYYLKKEWYKAILKLEEFMRKKGVDEDLVKESSDMLADSRNQLAADLGPLMGKARSLKEGQDLRTAYEAYLEILKIEPTNSEALNEVDDIRNSLDTRSKRIYREAIIAESLSLFNDAKEKFQEVQQISPTDSEYYKKASDKLKNYLE
ncbi:MAG: FHA domain-containing protein [Bdellovibrionales bacterium]|nr:FHA domain-containing protein [Bdellovibrionales bacterium]